MRKIVEMVMVSILSVSLLSVASLPVTAQSHSVKIEPKGLVSGSSGVDRGDSLRGTLSSSLSVRVMIYNNRKLIYNEEKSYHYLYKSLDEGFVEILVINENNFEVSVTYSLTVGWHDIILS